MDDHPGSLRLMPTYPFVGRSVELETLRSLMPRAEAEGRRVVMLGGEPGSGKSRVMREFAADAASGGALVLSGACDAVVGSPYGPFVEALDQLIRALEPAELRSILGTGGGELTRLIPDLPARAGALDAPVQADPDTERHRLHTAVTDLLTEVSRSTPVLLVLEDCHWADAPTLLLLRHLTRAAGEARILLLATFRDTESEVREPLSGTLADLRRFDDVVWLRLTGLSTEELTEFIGRATTEEAEAGRGELAAAISELTGGNAFLVCELWRDLVETRAVTVAAGRIELTRPLSELGTPESIREVVSQRLSRLAPQTQDLLELAAAAGAEFELSTIRGAAALDEAELRAALDEAERSGMIEELHSRTLAYRFSHELVRRALYDRLSGLRKAELHRRVGEALEGSGDRSARALADLAHHFASAAPLGETESGLQYTLLAARAATDALDFEQSAEWLRTALELPIENPTQRVEILLELGAASHRAGKALDAIEAYGSAALIAREQADGELLARAAIGYEEACWRPGIAEPGTVDLLEEAAAALGDESSELRVGLLGGLARALDFRGEHERGAIARANAIEMARTLGDREGLATVLMRSYWSGGTGSLGEILGMLREAKELGAGLGNTEIRVEAMAWTVPTYVALGEIESARREVGELSEAAEQTAQPFMIHVAAHYGSAIALGDGRLEDAERMADRSHEWSQVLTGRDPSGVYGIQMFSLRREQGRLAELAPVIRILAGGSREGGSWRPGLASLLVELGMEEEARRELGRVAGEGLEPYRESLWLASLTYLTDACSALGEERTAALLYPHLEPLGGGNVMIGHLVAFYGAADRYLGMLASTLGEWERAEQHFERAIELNRGMGALTWLAHTAYEYSRMLRRSPRGDPALAAALLDEAAELAERIGMSALLGRATAVGSASPPGLPHGLSAREAQILRLVAQGMSNREIGETLQISEHTAANHIRSILRKTGCANRTEAASFAHRHGLIEA